MPSHKFISRFYLLSLAILLTRCNGATPTAAPAASSPNIQVNPTGTSTEAVAETIHLDNCGNSATVQQTSARTQSISIEGEGSIGIGYPVIEASISLKYVKTKGVEKSHTVTASPNTNMEFVLLWTEEVNSGVVTVEGKSGQATYRVNIPIKVDQASAKDLGCSGQQPVVTQPASVVTIAPTQAPAPSIEFVKREATGAFTTAPYNVTLDDGEVIVGQAYGFSSGSINNTGGCSAFLIKGSGQFAFSVTDGAWLQYRNVTSEQAESLLQEQANVLISNYSCTAATVKYSRLP